MQRFGSPRVLTVVLLLVCTVVLARELMQGWYPHDEGVLGQSAERVLAGEVPHRDFDEIYTGLLSYVHAVAFHIGGVKLPTLRVPLFVMALLWVVACFRIAVRFAPPPGAALVALTAFLWGVPNYPASLPSWYNLFFATFGLLALLRWQEGGEARWLWLAGLAGGVSFLFKLTGIFYLFGGVLAIAVASGRTGAGPHATATTSDPARSTGWASGWATVSLALAAMLAVLAVPLEKAGTNVLVRFLLPLSLLVGAIAWRDRRDRVSHPHRTRAVVRALLPFAAGAAIPILLFGILMASADALVPAIDGVLLTPFRRLASASRGVGDPRQLAAAFTLALLLAPLERFRRTPLAAIVVATIAAVALGAVVYFSDGNVGVYRWAWLAAWGLPAVTAVAAAVLLIAPASQVRDTRRVNAAVMIVAVALGILLVEFPFAAPIYTMYALPVTMLALAAVVRAGGATPLPLQVVVLGFFLTFGAVRMLPSSLRMLGFGFSPSIEFSRLDVPRGGLVVHPLAAKHYAGLLELVQSLAPGRKLWAGPDSPEVYFLSGLPNQTRTMFDFLDAAGGDPTTLPARLRDLGISLVVLKMKPDFSTPIDVGTLRALREDFPNEREIPEFLVLWR